MVSITPVLSSDDEENEKAATAKTTNSNSSEDVDSISNLSYQNQQSKSPSHHATYSKCRPITTSLIRKRSEHNSNLISNLEEISLHQEELTSIGSTLGKVCGKTLKILLLQNNVIEKLNGRKEMKYFKVLEYLNLALNNITTLCCHDGDENYDYKEDNNVGNNNRLRPYSSYALNGEWNECLKKIDLTLNFIDFDTLTESLDCLATLPTLKELFLVGNPCCLRANLNDNGDDYGGENKNNKNSNFQQKGGQIPSSVWINFRYYVILKLPYLEYLDGQHISRSDRIKATQMKHQLYTELKYHIQQCHSKRQHQRQNTNHSNYHHDSDERMTQHCPQQRLQMSHEMAQQKAIKEQNEKANQPKIKTEQDYENDQSQKIDQVRNMEREQQQKIKGTAGYWAGDDGRIKQCNEGKWKFSFDEETNPGHITLDITIQKHLSSSLIDVDIHPTYVSIIIKSKVLRLVLPVEVKAEESTAKRSLTTGHLLLTMPKFNPKEYAFIVSPKQEQQHTRNQHQHTTTKKTRIQSGEHRKKIGLQQQLLNDARQQQQQQLTGPVQISNIVKHQSHCDDEDDYCELSKNASTVDIKLGLVESSTTRKVIVNDNNDDDKGKESSYCIKDVNYGPPPMF